jgi:hypothetical protein
VPEAYLAFPFAPGDARARAAAATVAAALDGEGGLLERALGAGGLSLSSSARIVGWPRAPALAVRVLGPQATLDAAVMQARALLDRLHQGGLGASDLERALVALDREAAAASLDPRARLIATWRDEPVPSPAQPAPSARATAEEVRAFASRALGEDAMVIVAARPARVRAAP